MTAPTKVATTVRMPAVRAITAFVDSDIKPSASQVDLSVDLLRYANRRAITESRAQRGAFYPAPPLLCLAASMERIGMSTTQEVLIIQVFRQTPGDLGIPDRPA